MGLGKTLQILAFLYCEKPEKPVLIVTPSSLTYNWKNEMQKFIPDASVMIIDGPGEERLELLDKFSEFDFLITSLLNPKEPPIINVIELIPFTILVFIKSASSSDVSCFPLSPSNIV